MEILQSNEFSVSLLKGVCEPLMQACTVVTPAAGTCVSSDPVAP